MAVMADFAKLPPRQKAMLFVVLAIALGLLYNQFVLKKLKANLAEAEGEHDQKVAENSRLERDIPEYEKLKARMVNLQRMIDENQKALPTEAELPAFFDMLNRKVLESGVEVVRSTQGKEVPVESFLKVPIDYEITGSYTQIKKFFASLLPKKKKPGEAPADGAQEVDEKERIVSIENLALSNPVVRNREIRLTAKFVASTYRQEEKEGAPQGPRPPSPPPAQPPKVNPSAAGASTPSGAKAKTDDAMDKNQTRNNGASGVDQGSARMKGGL